MFQFCPALDKHRDVRLKMEMKANFSMFKDEIEMAFIKYFNYFILPVYELYLKILVRVFSLRNSTLVIKLASGMLNK